MTFCTAGLKKFGTRAASRPSTRCRTTMWPGTACRARDGNEVSSMESFKAYYRQMRAALSDSM